MNPAAKWTTERYGKKKEVTSGTNQQPLLVFKVALALFQLGLRVILAALHDDPGFGLRGKVGAFKIVAPAEWRENSAYFRKPEELRNADGNGPFMISYARREKLEYVRCADGSPGRYITRANDVEPDMSIASYKKLAANLPTLVGTTFKWDLTEINLTKHDPFVLIHARNQKLAQQRKAPPVYAADQTATLFRDSAPGLNLLHVNEQSFWKRLSEAGCLAAEGVTSPYTYFGMAGTTFASHIEDMNLCSISYNHYGSPKVWYVVSADYRREVQALAERVLQEAEKNGCHAPLRHKHVILPPTLLTANNIPFTVLIQAVGEYVLTEAGAYHCGFNVGFNISEAVNYATEEWLEEGLRVFGGYYDTEAPMNTDVGELCVCDYRFKLFKDHPTDPVVRFESFPASEVCKLFHLRQRNFCALKKYTDVCVDLLRADGIEPPSVDLITDALQSVRITGPGAEPNPLREPLMFGTQPASGDGGPAVSVAHVQSAGRELCRLLPCCAKCLKSFSRPCERDVHEKTCSVPASSLRSEAVRAPSRSAEAAGSSTAAADGNAAPSAVAPVDEGPSVEGCSSPQVVASRGARRRRVVIHSSSSSSVGSDSESYSPPAKKKPPASSAKGESLNCSDVAGTSSADRKSAEPAATTSDDDRSLRALFREFMTSFPRVIVSLNDNLAIAPDRSTVRGPEPSASHSLAPSSGSSASAVENTVSGATRMYPCLHCGRDFPGRNRLTHQYSHERRYRCLVPTCRANPFTSSGNRAKHYRIAHEGESVPSSSVYEPIEPVEVVAPPAKQPRF